MSAQSPSRRPRPPRNAVQPLHVAPEMRLEPDLGDLGGAERVPAEAERLVEADVDLPGGAEGRDVAQERVGHLEDPRVERAHLAALERRTVGSPQLVQVAQLRHLDQVLGVPEEVDDRNDADARPADASPTSRANCLWL